MKAAPSAIRLLARRQQNTEIKISGKKVSLVTNPNPHNSPVKAARNGTRVDRIESEAVFFAPMPKRKSCILGNGERTSSNVQQQIIAMLNGTSIKSEQNI